MKITKEELTKIIKEELSGGTGGEANELLLFIQNDGDLYRQQYQPILKNLIAKKARGIYNPELAVKLFMYLVDNGAKKYDKEHGSGGKEWNLIFPKSIRLEVAKELRDHFETEAELGNYDNFLPKKYVKKEEGKMEEEVSMKDTPFDLDHINKTREQDAKSGVAKPLSREEEKMYKKFNKKNLKEVIEKVLKEASIDDINKELGSFQSLKTPVKDVPSEKEMGKATQQAFNKGLSGKKLREIISKVLEENSEAVRHLQEKCGGMKKLTEEPILHRGNQDEDFSEDDHATLEEDLNKGSEEKAHQLGAQFAQETPFKSSKDSKEMYRKAIEMGIAPSFFDIFKYGAQEVWRNKGELEEEKGHGKKPIINLPPEYLDKGGKMDWDKYGKEKGEKESLKEEPIEHRGNQDEDASEDEHLTLQEGISWTSSWKSFKKENK